MEIEAFGLAGKPCRALPPHFLMVLVLRFYGRMNEQLIEDVPLKKKTAGETVSGQNLPPTLWSVFLFLLRCTLYYIYTFSPWGT